MSALRIEDGMFEVKATGGDTRLGGEDSHASIGNSITKFRLNKLVSFSFALTSISLLRKYTIT